jgi:GNAT superfamily N-acetyltransferase
MIRRADETDMPFLLEVARRFWAIAPYAVGAIDEAAVEAVLCSLLDGGGVILRHEHGAIGGFMSPMWMRPQTRVATELFWWAERDGLALMRAFEDWAREQGAAAVNMVSLAGHERAGRLYERRGYAPVEQVYRRAL